MGACGFRVSRATGNRQCRGNGNAGGCGELFRADLGKERPDVSSYGFKGVRRSWEDSEHWGGGSEREEKAKKVGCVYLC